MPSLAPAFTVPWLLFPRQLNISSTNPSRRQMNLLLLPTEILVEILLYLDVPDSYAVQVLNCFFHNLYQTSLDLQYALECKIARVRDNPNCHLSIPERLRMLRKRESAWSSLTLTSRRTMKLPPSSGGFIPDSPIFQLQPHHCTMYRVVRSPGSLPQKEFQISPMRDISEDSFHSFQVDDMVHAGHCIDEHDLIAFLTRVNMPEAEIELRLVLIQYSTGNQHPLAEEPNILVCRDAVANMRFRFITSHIEIVGENLILTVNARTDTDPGRMYIYNWQTGKAKCEPIQVSCTDVVALNHNLFIIPDNKAWCLSILYIPSSSSGGLAKIIQRLKLPPCRGVWLRCRSLPNPTGDGRFPKHVSSSIPFMDHPDFALIRIAIPGPASLLIHRHSIMKLLPPPEDWTRVTEPPKLNWNFWGPPVSAIQAGAPTTYGQRALQGLGSDILSCDFNVYHVRRSAKTKEPDPYAMAYGATCIITQMHCVQIASPIHQHFSSIHIADGVVMGRQRDSDTVDVLYFGY